jgi:hypothetical protein
MTTTSPEARTRESTAGPGPAVLSWVLPLSYGWLIGAPSAYGSRVPL